MGRNTSKNNKRTEIPSELSGVSQDKVDRIEERLNKCYSAEDYKKFSEDVATIVSSVIGSEEGRKKVKELATEAVNEGLTGKNYVTKEDVTSIASGEARKVVHDEAWKSKSIWIPVVVSVLIGIFTVGSSIYIALRVRPSDPEASETSRAPVSNQAAPQK